MDESRVVKVIEWAMAVFGWVAVMSLVAFAAFGVGR